MELNETGDTVNYENGGTLKDNGEVEPNVVYNTVHYYEETTPNNVRNLNRDLNSNESDMINNPAYVSKRYNRLFSWSRKKTQAGKQEKHPEKRRIITAPIVLLALLCAVACLLSVAGLMAMIVEVRSLREEIKLLKEQNQTVDLQPVVISQENVQAITAGNNDTRILMEDVERLKAAYQNLTAVEESINEIRDRLDSQANYYLEELNHLRREVSQNITAIEFDISQPTSSPANVSQRCIRQTTTCTDSPGSNKYWSQCFTEQQPVEQSVS